jgi:hypothetical protein
MSKKVTSIVVCLLMIISSCSHKPFRAPSSVQGKDLESVINELGRAVQDDVNSTKQCHEGLDSYYKTLFKMTSSDINWDTLTDSNIDEIIKTSFSTRLIIKEKLKQLELESEMDHKCLSSVKDVFRALRYVEDYLIEIKAFNNGDDKKTFVNLKGDEPYFLVNKAFDFKGYEDLQSGDVILSRGNAYSSAAIARIGKNDMQFSHLSLVYKDENGKLWTSEAHIEIGSVIAPIETHIEQGNSRTVVFRYKDADMAHKAAKNMFDRVKKRMDKKDNIQYDFGMDYSEEGRLFCSEIIYWGYRNASEGKLDIPLYKTKFSKDLIPFLNVMGIKISEDNYEKFDTFAPGDIQFDPRFEMVAEWRNPTKMKDSRIKDMILTKMFEWMETLDYELRPPFGIKSKSKLSWLLRRTPLVKKMLEEKFPLNMSTKQLQLFLVLEDVGVIFSEYVEKYVKDSKRPLSPVEMYQLLDKYREEDHARWVKTKELEKQARRYTNGGPRTNRTVPWSLRKEIKKNKPHFHKLFHP